MRVALLTNFIPPYRVSIYKEIAKHLDDLHVFVSVAMESNRNWDVNHEGLNVTVQKNISFMKTWNFDYKSPVHLPYDSFIQLVNYNPDVVISVEMGIRTLLSSIYCKWYKKPHILWLALSEHTERNRKGLRLILRKFLLRRTSVILCNGESGKRYIKSLGFNGRVFFMPYTSDYKLRAPKTNFGISSKKILYTGSLINRKGIKELVSNIISWSRQNSEQKIELIVAGEGFERERFQALDKTQNVSYQLLGNISYADLQRWYREVDLYVFPTLEDEWGVVVNEAFASGVPVIGSIYSQAVLELVKEGETGWQFDPLDEQSFQRALNKAIFSNKEELSKMSKNALSTIDLYRPEKIAINAINAIKWVMRTK